jgi:hypothetical protein
MYVEICPICNLEVTDSAAAIGFGAIAGTENHPFYGATAHQSCLNRLGDRDELLRYWNEALARVYSVGYLHLVVNQSGEVEYRMNGKPLAG